MASFKRTCPRTRRSRALHRGSTASAGERLRSFSGARWQDLTGKGRSDEQRKADYQACYETSGFRPDGTWAVSFNESIEELHECLLERGWKSSSMGIPRTKRDGGAWRWASPK
jgi:hypothetical protein